MLVKLLPSGSIDLADSAGGLRLEFNCACMDALPYCHALCCRLRPSHNAPITPDETLKFHHEMHPDGFPVVVHNPAGDCIYLDHGHKCSVHSDKPAVCQLWHCSPGGRDSRANLVPIRGNGWVLSTAAMNTEFIQEVLE